MMPPQAILPLETMKRLKEFTGQHIKERTHSSGRLLGSTDSTVVLAFVGLIVLDAMLAKAINDAEGRG